MPTPTLANDEPTPDFGGPVRAHQHGAWTAEEARRREGMERARRTRARIGKSVLVAVIAFTIASLVGLAARALHERAPNDAAPQLPAG